MFVPTTQQALAHLVQTLGTQGVFVHGQRIFSATVDRIETADVRKHLGGSSMPQLERFLSNLEQGNLSGISVQVEAADGTDSVHETLGELIASLGLVPSCVVAESQGSTISILSQFGATLGAAFCYVDGSVIRIVMCAEQEWSGNGEQQGIADILAAKFTPHCPAAVASLLEAGGLDGQGYFAFATAGNQQLTYPILDKPLTEIFARRVRALKCFEQLQITTLGELLEVIKERPRDLGRVKGINDKTINLILDIINNELGIPCHLSPI